MNQPAFLAAAVLVAVGTFGWGRAFFAVVGRFAPSAADDGDDAPTSPMVMAVGFAVVLAVAGFAVALGVCRLPEIVGILGLGVISTAIAAARWWGGADHRRPNVRTVGVAAAFAVVSFLAYGATLTGPINPNDDDPGYVYLAYRLLATGGLVDPFNLRRITSYGGGEFFEALFVRAGGSGAALGTEWFFGVLLVTALVVRRVSRPYAWLVALVLGVALTVVHPVGIWANSAPTFTGLALTVALLQLLLTSVRSGRNWPRDLTIGVLLGGLFDLRFEFAVPAIVAIVIAAIVGSGRRAWRPIGVIAAGTVATIAGWAIALERSSKTLLFPIFPGDYNESFPWQDPAFRTAGQFVRRLWGEVNTDAWGVTMLGIVVACAVLIAIGRRWRALASVRPTITVALGGALGCAVLMVSETRTLSGGVLADIGRYNAPSALALALFVADDLWARSSVPATVERSDGGDGPVRRFLTRCRTAPVVCATMALVLVAIPIGAAFPTVPPYGSAIHAVGHAAYDEGEFAVKRLDGSFGGADRLDAARPPYAAINRVVPRGARVLAAVTAPGLLDFSRFDFATLDIAGAVSPPPGIPLTRGGTAVRKYLTGLGYNGIVASVTSAPGLDNYRDWAANTTSGIEDYRAMATEFTAWARVLSQLAHDRSVHRTRIGTLEYLAWSTPKGTR